MKKLWIIDGYHFVIRNYYASNGADGVIGFFNSLFSLINTKGVKNIVIAWDDSSDTPNIRKNIYPEYKQKKISKKKKKEKEIIQNEIDTVKLICKSKFGIPSIEVKGYEADDIIKNIVNFNKEKGINIIVTADKDMKQLLNKNTYIYDFFSRYKESKIFKRSVKNFKKEYGFHPKDMLTYLALKGDSSDNIPGVKGIGKKYAKKLVSKYGNIDNILDNINEIEADSSLANKIKSGKDDLILSGKLVELKSINNFDKAFKKKDLSLNNSIKIGTGWNGKMFDGGSEKEKNIKRKIKKTIENNS